MNRSDTRKELRLRYQDRCAYCARHVGDRGTVDHFLPLALGGGEFDIDNLRWACRPCNEQKADTHPDVWLARIASRGTPRSTRRYTEKVRLLVSIVQRRKKRCPQS